MTGRIKALLFLLLGASAAGGAPAALELLQPVPRPNLENLEPSVRENIELARETFDRVRGQAAEGNQQLAGAYGTLGKTYHANGLLGAAQACYRNAQVLAPDDLRWPYLLAHAYLADDTDPDARAIASASLGRVLTIRPAYPPAMLNLALLQLQDGRLDLAQMLFEQALEQNPEEAAALAGLGRVALERGEARQAIDRLEAALASQPTATKLHYSLAMAYRADGDIDSARQHLGLTGDTEVRIREPLLEDLAERRSGARAYLARGMAAVRLGHYARAADYFRQAVASDPENARAWMNLGATLGQLGMRDEAIQAIAESVRLDPDKAMPRYNLATLYALSQRDTEAIPHFRRAVQVAPDHAGALLGLADALARRGNQVEAVAYYRRAVHSDPGNAVARLRQVMALVRLHRYREARRALAEGLGAMPRQGDLLHVLARLMAASPDDRVRDGPQALRIAQDLYRARQTLEFGETLAMARAETGAFDQAVVLQEQLQRSADKAGLADRAIWLREDLEGYRQGRPARVPWRDTDPLFYPPP